MALTVSTGSDLIAKLRIRKTDVHAEQHILDLVQSIRQASSSVNTSLASEQQRLEVLSVKSNWQKEVSQECEKLSDWRCQNRPIGENGKKTKPDLGNRNSDFGPQVTQESFLKCIKKLPKIRAESPALQTLRTIISCRSC